jgi:hypothetical protein
MQDTIRPFHLGSNIMIEITNGTVRQLEPVTLKLLKEIPVSSLNEQQIAGIEKAREACTAAMIAQGFLPADSINRK